MGELKEAKKFTLEFDFSPGAGDTVTAFGGDVVEFRGTVKAFYAWMEAHDTSNIAEILMGMLDSHILDGKYLMTYAAIGLRETVIEAEESIARMELLEGGQN